jgi:hypothetical protein
MGDLPKPSDDATWTEVERSFFAAAPPDDPEPLGEAPRFDDLAAPRGQRPRRALVARLRPAVAGAWRRATLVLGAAGGHVRLTWPRTALIIGAAAARARDTARAGAAGLVAALSVRRLDRRRVGFAFAFASAFALMGAIVTAGLSAGVVAFRKGTLTEGAPAATERPVSGPTIVDSAADVQAPRAGVSNRRRHAHRRPVPASSSSQRPLMTAFVDRETYWTREARSAPVRSSRPFFSR